MKKIIFVLLVLISAQHMFPMEANLDSLQQKLKSQRIYSWFALSVGGFVVGHYLCKKAALLEKELTQKWFWNPQTQQEEFPVDADQTTPRLYNISGRMATFIGLASWIWGIKQIAYVARLALLINMQKERIDAESDPGFRRWRQQTNGSYSTYKAQERASRSYEAFDPQFKQWRQTNPGGNTFEYAQYCHSRGGTQFPSPEMPSYYEILGVDRTARTTQIRRAYLKLARENHPDKTSGITKLSQEEDATRENKMREINHARDVLTNEVLRTAYDANWELRSETERRSHVTAAMNDQTKKQQQESEAHLRNC